MADAPLEQGGTKEDGRQHQGPADHPSDGQQADETPDVAPGVPPNTGSRTSDNHKPPPPPADGLQGSDNDERAPLAPRQKGSCFKPSSRFRAKETPAGSDHPRSDAAPCSQKAATRTSPSPRRAKASPGSQREAPSSIQR